jgi:hypothetical protein
MTVAIEYMNSRGFIKAVRVYSESFAEVCNIILYLKAESGGWTCIKIKMEVESPGLLNNLPPPRVLYPLACNIQMVIEIHGNQSQTNGAHDWDLVGRP